MDDSIDVFKRAGFRVLKDLETDEYELRMKDFTFIYGQDKEGKEYFGADNLLIYFDEVTFAPSGRCLYMMSDGKRVAVLDIPTPLQRRQVVYP